MFSKPPDQGEQQRRIDHSGSDETFIRNLIKLLGQGKETLEEVSGADVEKRSDIEAEEHESDGSFAEGSHSGGVLGQMMFKVCSGEGYTAKPKGVVALMDAFEVLPGLQSFVGGRTLSLERCGQRLRGQIGDGA